MNDRYYEKYKPRRLLVRSWILFQAERLGQARFDELLRNLNLPKSSASFSQHKLLAENAERLMKMNDEGVELPHTMGALCRLARRAMSRQLLVASYGQDMPSLVKQGAPDHPP